MPVGVINKCSLMAIQKVARNLDCKVVITSSVRFDDFQGSIEESLNLGVIDRISPYFSIDDLYSRHTEITRHAEQFNNNENIIVIESSDLSTPSKNNKYFYYPTSPEKGFSNTDADNIIANLN